MPRRNRQSESYKPLDLTPDQIQGPKPRPRSVSERRPHVCPNPISVKETEKAERQRIARMNQGIDWQICVIPGCGRELHSHNEGRVLPQRRDTDLLLPMCTKHAVVIWRQVSAWWPEDPTLKAEIAEQRDAAEKRDHDAERRSTELAQGGNGIIYFLRQNGLVKIGWTADIFKRLRAYGPNVELLCTYPGTRGDETTLHRQLRDHLAKGREWYHDNAAIALFVNNALEHHGPQSIPVPDWTEPKKPMIRQRKRR